MDIILNYINQESYTQRRGTGVYFPFVQYLLQISDSVHIHYNVYTSMVNVILNYINQQSFLGVENHRSQKTPASEADKYTVFCTVQFRKSREKNFKLITILSIMLERIISYTLNLIYCENYYPLAPSSTEYLRV